MDLQLGYVFLFVPDVAAALSFYEAAFGLQRRYLDESGMYGELETGTTTLAFAQDDFVQSASGVSHRRTMPTEAAPGVSFTLVTEDVDAAWRRAVEHGVTVVSPPLTKPWGQTVGYIRDLNGVLLEIATPVSA